MAISYREMAFSSYSTAAGFSTDFSADHPVGMAYLLGNWATDRQATAVAGRRETANLYQACLII